MALLPLIIGFVASLLIAALAFQRGSLAYSGILGAVIVGTLVFAGGGLAWGVLLVAFFVTSSFLSHYAAREKEPLADKFEKGHRRDLGQVLANGGWGALLALAFALSPQPILFVAFVGAMATVNADTWATELGVLSPHPPRLVTNGRTVAIGTSGGVTLLGTTASLAGALLIGLLGFLSSFGYSWLPGILPRVPDAGLLIPVGALAGLVGSLFDSLLGATVQAIYYCDYDRKETESAIHRCGNAARQIRGWRWMNNDWVNFAASIAGSAVAAAAYSGLAELASGL